LHAVAYEELSLLAVAAHRLLASPRAGLREPALQVGLEALHVRTVLAELHPARLDVRFDDGHGRSMPRGGRPPSSVGERVCTLDEVQRASLAPFFALAAALSLCASAGADELVLSGVTVIDGAGRPPRADEDVVVRDGRIAEVRPHAASSAPGARVLELGGL